MRSGHTKFRFFISLIPEELLDLTLQKLPTPPVLWIVDRLTRADRICAVAAAAAHDLNDDLTVILSSVTGSIRALEPGHPARALLLDLQAAAQRCAWTASGLLKFSARAGARPSAATFERLAEAEDEEVRYF